MSQSGPPWILSCLHEGGIALRKKILRLPKHPILHPSSDWYGACCFVAAAERWAAVRRIVSGLEHLCGGRSGQSESYERDPTMSPFYILGGFFVLAVLLWGVLRLFLGASLLIFGAVAMLLGRVPR